MQTLADEQRIKEAITNVLDNNDISSIKLKSRVYFRNQERVPMFGTFVMMKDHADLWTKGMVRLLLDSKVPTTSFIGEKEFKANETHTKILTVSEIASIRNF